MVAGTADGTSWKALICFLVLLQSVLQQLRLLRPSKAKVKVLNQVSGVLKPGRLTLLLGPPGGGQHAP